MPNATYKPVGLLTLLLTIDSVSDVSRVTRGLAIRRAKKRVKLTNDKCMKICFAEMHATAVCAVIYSHAVGSEKMLSESHSDADDDDDTEAPDDN